MLKGFCLVVYVPVLHGVCLRYSYMTNVFHVYDVTLS